MIFLEQTVNQILLEEGQFVLSLSDLEITWEMLENLFIGTYEQCKGYISVYDWTTQTLGTDPIKKDDWTHIRHLTYNAYNNMQRFMPDVPSEYWEFNPYTKNASSLMSTNFSVEAGMYPTCQQLDYPLEFKDVKKGQKLRINLPFIFDPNNFTVSTPDKNLDIKATETTTTISSSCDCPPVDTEFDPLEQEECICCDDTTSTDIITMEGEDGNGSFDTKSLNGIITFNNDYDKVILNLKTKYVAIKELDLTCELFYNWFKANVLTTIGAVKKQLDVQGVNLPFDINQDELLSRGREIMQKVEQLKADKMHWSNF